MDTLEFSPLISLRQAWSEMNKLDQNGKPIPFEVWGSAEKTGKVIKFKNCILARNTKNLGGNSDSFENVENDDWIFAEDWKFYLIDTEEIKSMKQHLISHLNSKEVNYPQYEQLDTY